MNIKAHLCCIPFLVGLTVFFTLPDSSYEMIITSVFAGPKKYKTVSFDFLPIPLTYSVPNKFQFAYRGHYAFKRPNFNVNMAVPVTLPMNFIPPPPEPEPEYGHEAAGSEGDEEATYAAETDGENQEHSIDDATGVADHPKLHQEGSKYAGYDGKQSVPDLGPQRPYTGKAQVSSFIDNGQFVNAHNAVLTRTLGSSSTEDAAFGDELPPSPPLHPDRRSLLKDGKTVSLGYETKGHGLKTDPITLHNRHPDSLPWGMTDYTDLQKYYTTFTFTDQFRHPATFYEPKKKKLLSGLLFG